MASGVNQLSNEEISRYGRQLILPEWGIQGQQKIKSAAVLIVGAGGLGCPAAQYLAAAGVGHLGIVDYDEVEVSNLHRQILHSEKRVGLAKADSAHIAIESLNSHVKVSAHCVLLNSSNVPDIIDKYDVIVDATDNVATRYLLNDACILYKKPLVSGSALRFEGQLTVYNYNGGPCYRCLFPSPPPPNTVTNCSEGGVLGVIPGVIGTLQALEVLKILTGVGDVLSSKLLMFDGLLSSFRVIKLRSHDPMCVVCGEAPSITKLIDYEVFCNSSANDKEKHLSILKETDRISCQEYKSILDEGKPHVLLDVREPVEYEICHLQQSHNIPFGILQKSVNRVADIISETTGLHGNVPLYVICRRGNDSQHAVQLLREMLPSYLTAPLPSVISDIIGGLTHWSDAIDNTFPKY